jgi:hypothetical protein
MASTAATARNLSLALSAALLAACSGSSGGGGSSAVTLAVTDAASDEVVSFVVRLASVRLQSAGGDTVDVLPDAVGVDFAELTDLSRVLNIQRVQPGQYVGAEVTLDFSDASAVLIGNQTPAAIVDSDGNVLTGVGAPLVVLPVAMATPLALVAGRNHVLELDFDLDQSVDVDSGANVVVVEPNLLVRFDPTQPKELAIGGQLRNVQAMDGTFRIGLAAAAAAPIPIVTVAIDDESVFQIDGVATEGDVGLAALADLPVGSWVQAFGSVDTNAAQFRAVAVEAGRGSYNGGSDIVEGHIIERVGGVGADAVLTVLGHSNNSTHAFFTYNNMFTVNTSFANTKVVQRGSVDPFDLDDLNVGQHVRLFGTLNAPTGNILDVTGAADVIRMQPTMVLGFSNAAPASGQLEIELARVDLRLENAFTWTDSGATPPDPLQFVMEIGTLASQPEGLGIHAGNLVTPVSAVGYFAPIDDTGADFVATRLVNRRLANSLLVVHDRDGGLTVTPTVTANQVLLELSGTPVQGEAAMIDQGFVGETAMASPSAPSIVPRLLPLGAGYYTIRDRTMSNAVTTYFFFDDFTAGLDAKLMAGAVIYNISAVGPYSATFDQISSSIVGVVVD